MKLEVIINQYAEQVHELHAKLKEPKNQEVVSSSQEENSEIGSPAWLEQLWEDDKAFIHGVFDEEPSWNC